MSQPPLLTRFINDVRAGRFPADLPGVARAVITFVTLAATVGVAITSLVSSPGGTGSSESPGNGSSTMEPEPASPEEQVRLTQLEQEVGTALNQWRLGNGLPPGLPWPDRQGAAREQARQNAAAGKESPSPENISQLQVNLPAEGATGYAVVEKLRASRPHLEVVLNPANTFQAVAAEIGHGRVWVVIQFEQ